MPARLAQVPRSRRVLAGTAVLLAAGVGLTTLPADAVDPATTRTAATAPATAKADPVTWASGAYSGISRNETNEFARWRGGRAATAITQFQGSGSRHEMTDVQFLGDQFRGTRSRLLLSVGFWPQNEKGSLALAAKGSYDDIYRQLATNLVAQGLGNITLRPGWEFNGDWMPWRVLSKADARHFQYAWRHMVITMKRVPGARFTFDWAPVAANNLLDPALSWPGAKFVDFIGMSVYNYTPNAARTAPGKRFAQLVNWKYGMRWQYAFAVKHKKRVTYPEWAQINRPFSPSVSTGDDDFFILAMWNWFRKTKPAYEMYFDTDTLDFTFYGIATGSDVNPKSSAMYQKLWARPS